MLKVNFNFVIYCVLATPMYPINIKIYVMLQLFYIVYLPTYSKSIAYIR